MLRSWDARDRERRRWRVLWRRCWARRTSSWTRSSTNQDGRLSPMTSSGHASPRNPARGLGSRRQLSVIRDITWSRADTVVWFDLPYLRVMARTIRRTVRRVLTREELWNGNREPLSNLWSFNPEKSIIAWTATRHRVYRRRYRAAEIDPQWAALRFVRLRPGRGGRLSRRRRLGPDEGGVTSGPRIQRQSGAHHGWHRRAWTGVGQTARGGGCIGGGLRALIREECGPPRPRCTRSALRSCPNR